jgi:hypothetical protein
MQQQEEPELPYGGDIQAAIRNQDREAVKRLLAARNHADTEETKQVVNADALQEALMALGFAEAQVAEAFQEAGQEKLSAGVKRLLESDRQLPTPKKQRDAKSTQYDNRVTEQMLRRIDAESIWVLMQVTQPNELILWSPAWGLLFV